MDEKLNRIEDKKTGYSGQSQELNMLLMAENVLEGALDKAYENYDHDLYETSPLESLNEPEEKRLVPGDIHEYLYSEVNQQVSYQMDLRIRNIPYL